MIASDVNQPSFPPAGLTLLTTVTAQSGTRRAITVQNQDSNAIQVWRDMACTGTQLSLIILAPGGAGAQGSAWSSNTFSGCLRIYGTGSGARVAIWQD